MISVLYGYLPKAIFQPFYALKFQNIFGNKENLVLCTIYVTVISNIMHEFCKFFLSKRLYGIFCLFNRRIDNKVQVIGDMQFCIAKLNYYI